jgi:hypothetical protein
VSQKKTKSLSQISLMVLNTENLFLLSDQPLQTQHLSLSETEWQKLSTSIYPNKPLAKVEWLAEVIDQQNPNIVILSEIGGLESLKNFNQLFLKDKYFCALEHGNSDRNIDVGFLISKKWIESSEDQKIHFNLISNKNKLIPLAYHNDEVGISYKFARDIPELHFYKTSGKDTSIHHMHPFLICLAVHLKSRLDPEGIDPGGYSRRRAEVRALIDIYTDLKSKFPNTPILIGGDFNGNASELTTDDEFLDLYKLTDLKDALQLAQVPWAERVTFVSIPRNQKTEGRQIDYCFLNTLAQKILTFNSARVYRYQDSQGIPLPLPNHIDDKLKLPSDHYPLVLGLDIGS